MSSNYRRYVGPVQGGRTAREIPGAVFNQNTILPHVQGRVEAMTEMLLQVAFVKAEAMACPSSRLFYAGAKYQDFKGSRPGHIVMAHRSIMALNFGSNLNFAELANRGSKLQQLLISAQARTDPMLPAANYGDRILEIMAADPLLAIFQEVFERQPSNRPVETNLIVDASYELRSRLEEGCLRAAERHTEIRRELGWVELRPGQRSNDVKPTTANLNLQSLRQQLAQAGPQLDLEVDERLAPANFKFLFDKASDSGDYPQIYLGVSADVTKSAAPSLINRDKVEESAELLAEAKAATASPATKGSSLPSNTEV